MHPEERLAKGLVQLDIELPVQTQQKLLDYLQLMLKWNKAYNLTAIRELDSMVIRHVLDSISILPYINGTPVLDVGTGPGLPGIPLALCLPDYQFVLLDSNGKKTRFLTQCKIDLMLNNIDIVKSRVEDYKPDFSFEIVTCRAFAALNTVLECTEHLLTSSTRILAMKGKDELPALNKGYRQLAQHQLQVPWLNEDRQLIEILSDK
ncbi:16S rRNA (guanine(527)-N(7))-methyltransferase [hydrothermal vent metagenome]|uniref:16S rRNA (Guanine(527)-N(7))-methyltransferase n=1 Tax=hydrothermal vent metagenome TaxID=652676 RepID=A0A3B0WSE8_9ZZZZ